MTYSPAPPPQIWVDADACPGPIKDIPLAARVLEKGAQAVNPQG